MAIKIKVIIMKIIMVKAGILLERRAHLNAVIDSKALQI